MGSEGRVYAVEVEAERVAALEERVAQAGFTNVEVVFGGDDDPRLPEAVIDLAMTCLTYHHIGGRESARLAFARYIELRVASGHFRRVDSLPLAARIVIETCATWAVHIHWDRAPELFDPAQARDTTIDFLVRGLLSQTAFEAL